MRWTVDTLAAALADGGTTARALCEQAIARVETKDGEGARAFVGFDPAAVRADADAADALLKRGVRLSALHGLPISVKDLFDVAGAVTRAGSLVRADQPRAARDATAIGRLRSAGAIFIGRTNMTEFAYSGIGFNPHYGTPAAPYDRAGRRVPGGSSSGAAVSVSDGMAVAGIGTDTGGSCRIPAAFCGIVGFKPTAARVPLDGAFPLAKSLDSIGPLTRSVACAAAFDAVMAGEVPQPLPALPLSGLRLAAAQGLVVDGLELDVATAYGEALSRLSVAGAIVGDVTFATLSRTPGLFAKGGISAAEAYALHRSTLQARGGDYDPKVRIRIEAGASQSAADYLDLIELRRRLVAEFDRETAPFDAVLMPTVAILPPPIALFGNHQSLEDYQRLNGLTLRNTAIANQLDRCAISLPLTAPGAAPVGLMLIGERHADRRLLGIAQAIELALGPARD